VKPLAIIPGGLMIVLLTIALAAGQKPNTDVVVFQLGDQPTRIPAPEGFEEAAAQFENIKDHFTRTEDPQNDMLAVHLPRADCEKLRANLSGSFNFYTKVSVRRDRREAEYSAEQFAALIEEFRKHGAQYLDVNSPSMKATIDRLSKGVSESKKEETRIDLSQPVNLGEFDTRPNVYAVMLLLNLKTQSSSGETTVPILGGLSFVRVKQRLIYVYTYRKYQSKQDIEVLRDFTRKWVGEILAAN
jgi:hypothetical protein